MSDLKIIEELKITHCLKAQDIKYSTFKLYNSSPALIYKNIEITPISVGNKIEFKITSNTSVDTEVEWEDEDASVFIASIQPKEYVELKIRSVAKNTTPVGVYDCKFNISYTTQGV